MREETTKTTTLQEEIDSLRHLTAGGLREKYLAVFGEASRSGKRRRRWEVAIRLAISRMASSSAGSWAGMVVSWAETTHNDLRLAVEGCLVGLLLWCR